MVTWCRQVCICLLTQHIINSNLSAQSFVCEKKEEKTTQRLADRRQSQTDSTTERPFSTELLLQTYGMECMVKEDMVMEKLSPTTTTNCR